jgi:hypothetical protein
MQLKPNSEALRLDSPRRHWAVLRSAIMTVAAWAFFNVPITIGLTQLLLWVVGAMPWFEGPRNAQMLLAYLMMAGVWGVFRAQVLDPHARDLHNEDIARRKALAAVRVALGSGEALEDMILSGGGLLPDHLQLSTSARREIVGAASHLAQAAQGERVAVGKASAS